MRRFKKRMGSSDSSKTPKYHIATYALNIIMKYKSNKYPALSELIAKMIVQ
jgi:hypothetical protein